MEYIYFIITGVVCLGLGIFFTSIVNKKILTKKRKKFMEDARAEAEMLKKEKILQAKETFLQLKAEHEKSINERNRKIAEIETKVKQKESQLSQRIEEFQRKQRETDNIRQNLSTKLDLISKKETEIDKLHKKQVEQLEIIAGMSAGEAKNQLIESLKEEAKTAALSYIKDIVEESRLAANKEAKRIIIQTIQRLASEQTVENTVTVFHIGDDVVKGRIIGREGRNVRALESATGVTFNIDDTPDAIVLSCFDPLKREIARLALHQLVLDGRIHPARIEEVVEKTKKQIDQEIVEVGKQTLIDFGIHGLHPNLIYLIGKMKYRTSYGQNLLQHSREVANLCAIMASELGLNVKTARRAGLLHDIGKVSEENPELSHAILGMQLAEKYKEKPEICNAIGSHHEEIEMNTVIAPIVQICDAISGARPGARREVVQLYLKRVENLEALALSFAGVQKTYAIHAGRELRVIVESDKVTDEQAQKLSIEIAQKIQKEMIYPGQVKVMVIRETRAINIAK